MAPVNEERHNSVLYKSFNSSKTDLNKDLFSSRKLTKVNIPLVGTTTTGYLSAMELMKSTFKTTLALVFATLLSSSYLYASSGTEGAAFLDIPVGGAPAAMGGAYTSQATDVYAPVWNAGGLGFAEGTQLSGMYLSYLESIHYQFISFSHQLNAHNGIGFAVQNLSSGDIGATDQTGASIGTFDVRYSAYSLAYGHSFNDKLSLGATGKMIQARLSDVSASAYAADLGAIYKANSKLTLGLSAVNLGSKLKFISEGDDLPMAVRAGATYEMFPSVKVSMEGAYRKTGLGSMHMGVEWSPITVISLRGGYRTDTLKELSALAGMSVGLGLHVMGQEFDYAWVPLGDLGNTQYFSLVLRFGGAAQQKRNLIYYEKNRRIAKKITEEDPEYKSLQEMLSSSERKAAVAQLDNGSREEDQY